MIVAFSSSSPLASTALISESGELLASGEELAPTGASGACLEILQTLLQTGGRSLNEATLFAADLGPGSFTGVKVAVTLAKTMAFAHGVQTVGADAFDLIAPDQTVVFPSKRGEYFVRSPGHAPVRTTDLPAEEFIGFGPGVEPATYPHAKRFAALVATLHPVAPERLVPNYLIEPSISVPKNPYVLPGANG